MKDQNLLDFPEINRPLDWQKIDEEIQKTRQHLASRGNFATGQAIFEDVPEARKIVDFEYHLSQMIHSFVQFKSVITFMELEQFISKEYRVPNFEALGHGRLSRHPEIIDMFHFPKHTQEIAQLTSGAVYEEYYTFVNEKISDVKYDNNQLTSRLKSKNKWSLEVFLKRLEQKYKVNGISSVGVWIPDFQELHIAVSQNMIKEMSEMNRFLQKISNDIKKQYDSTSKEFWNNKSKNWGKIVEELTQGSMNFIKLARLDLVYGQIAHQWTSSCFSKPFYIAASSMAMSGEKTWTNSIIAMAALYIYLELKRPNYIADLKSHIPPLGLPERQFVANWVKRCQHGNWKYGNLTKYMSFQYAAKFHQISESSTALNDRFTIYQLCGALIILSLLPEVNLSIDELNDSFTLLKADGRKLPKVFGDVVRKTFNENPRATLIDIQRNVEVLFGTPFALIDKWDKTFLETLQLYYPDADLTWAYISKTLFPINVDEKSNDTEDDKLTTTRNIEEPKRNWSEEDDIKLRSIISKEIVDMMMIESSGEFVQIMVDIEKQFKGISSTLLFNKMEKILSEFYPNWKPVTHDMINQLAVLVHNSCKVSSVSSNVFTRMLSLEDLSLEDQKSMKQVRNCVYSAIINYYPPTALERKLPLDQILKSVAQTVFMIKKNDSNNYTAPVVSSSLHYALQLSYSNDEVYSRLQDHDEFIQNLLIVPALSDIADTLLLDPSIISSLIRKEAIILSLAEHDFVPVEYVRERFILVKRSFSNILKFGESLSDFNSLEAAHALISIIHLSLQPQTIPLIKLRLQAFINSAKTNADIFLFVLDSLTCSPLSLSCMIFQCFWSPCLQISKPGFINDFLIIAHKITMYKPLLLRLGKFLDIVEWQTIADDNLDATRECSDEVMMNFTNSISLSDEHRDSLINEPISYDLKDYSESIILISSKKPDQATTLTESDDLILVPDRKRIDSQDLLGTHIDSPTSSSVDACKKFIEELKMKEFGIGVKTEDEATKAIMDAQYQRTCRAITKLAEELYAQDFHFVLELLQNADDNLYAPNVEPELQLVVHNDSLILLNNELGFSKENIRSLCDIGNSTKDQKQEELIGQKGIGFKSVFRITDAPEIHSNGFHVRFDKKDFIVPEWLDSHGSHLPSNELSSLCKRFNTVMVLPFNHKMSNMKLMEKMKDLNGLILLFLRKVQSITIQHNNQVYKMKKLVQNENIHNIIVIQENELETEWFVYKVFVPTLDAPGTKRSTNHTCIQIGFPINFLKEDYGNVSHPDMPVFAYLPVRHYGFKFVIQADFFVTSSREDLDYDTPFNLWIFSKLPLVYKEAFSSCFEKLKQRLDLSKIDHDDDKEEQIQMISDKLIGFLGFVPSLNRISGVFRPIAESMLKEIQNLPCILSYNDQWCRPKDVIIIKHKISREFPMHFIEKSLGLVPVHPLLANSSILSESLNVPTFGIWELLNVIEAYAISSNIDYSSIGPILSLIWDMFLRDNLTRKQKLEIVDRLKGLKILPVRTVSGNDLSLISSTDSSNIFYCSSREESEKILSWISMLRFDCVSIISINDIAPSESQNELDQIFQKLFSVHEFDFSVLVDKLFFENTVLREDFAIIAAISVAIAHFEYDLHSSRMHSIEFLKKKLPILTNQGIQFAEKSEIYLDEDFDGTFAIGAHKDLFTVVSDKYVKLIDELKFEDMNTEKTSMVDCLKKLFVSMDLKKDLEKSANNLQNLMVCVGTKTKENISEDALTSLFLHLDTHWSEYRQLLSNSTLSLLKTTSWIPCGKSRLLAPNMICKNHLTLMKHLNLKMDDITLLPVALENERFMQDLGFQSSFDVSKMYDYIKGHWSIEDMSRMKEASLSLNEVKEFYELLQPLALSKKDMKDVSIIFIPASSGWPTNRDKRVKGIIVPGSLCCLKDPLSVLNGWDIEKDNVLTGTPVLSEIYEDEIFEEIFNIFKIPQSPNINAHIDKLIRLSNSSNDVNDKDLWAWRRIMHTLDDERFFARNEVQENLLKLGPAKWIPSHHGHWVSLEDSVYIMDQIDLAFLEYDNIHFIMTSSSTINNNEISQVSMSISVNPNSSPLICPYRCLYGVLPLFTKSINHSYEALHADVELKEFSQEMIQMFLSCLTSFVMEFNLPVESIRRRKELMIRPVKQLFHIKSLNENCDRNVVYYSIEEDTRIKDNVVFTITSGHVHHISTWITQLMVKLVDHTQVSMTQSVMVQTYFDKLAGLIYQPVLLKHQLERDNRLNGNDFSLLFIGGIKWEILPGEYLEEMQEGEHYTGDHIIIEMPAATSDEEETMDGALQERNRAEANESKSSNTKKRRHKDTEGDRQVRSKEDENNQGENELVKKRGRFVQNVSGHKDYEIEKAYESFMKLNSVTVRLPCSSFGNIQAPQEQNTQDRNLKAKFTGKLGEQAAYLYLKNLHQANPDVQVQWMNEIYEKGLPYDILITKRSSGEHEFVEVKSTICSWRDNFELSLQEWNFAMKHGSAFTILRLSQVRWANSNTTLNEANKENQNKIGVVNANTKEAEFKCELLKLNNPVLLVSQGFIKSRYQLVMFPTNN